MARLRAAGCVFAEDEARLLIEAGGDLSALVARRIAGEPLEVLLGWAEFAGRRVAVDAGVFVPRRRSELLVALASSRLASGGVVVELCCGTAAVATVLAGAGVEAHAADIDPAAVGCARRNLDGRGTVYRGDLYEALPSSLRGRVDVLIANAPYVPTSAIALMPPEARLHEPRQALDGGPDGLDVQRRVAAAAPAWLAEGGALLIETSVEQAPATVALMTAVGLAAQVHRDEDLDATAVLGELRARA